MYRGKNKPEGVCLPYLDVVEESLCFGWIDSTLKRLPDGRLAQRLSPRQKRSHWTELNKQRCADLEQRGLMTDLGRAALQRTKKDGKKILVLAGKSVPEVIRRHAGDTLKEPAK